MFQMTLFPRILKNSIIRFIEILTWSEFQGSSRMLRGSARLSPNALAVTLGSEEVSCEHPWSRQPRLAGGHLHLRGASALVLL